MEENLVIVESPAKAKTIKKFLGKDYLVTSSYGHIRDLAKKNFGVDIENGYEPQYEVSPEKTKVVNELKKLAKKATTIWLASDEDREGEAIAWHLAEVLKLNETNSHRIVFHEITKEAINKAVENPKQIDKNLVRAQQARRVLDRLVGFELSPLLWKKVKPSLSAGRVQSVAVRLLVEREREIIAFKSVSTYKVFGIFHEKDQNKTFKADLNKKFKTKKEALNFLEKCKNAQFAIDNIEKKSLKKSPAPPFTTSTLQQEASRKLSFSVAQTMRVAQKLYEAGKITYMRTDSLNLSDLALNASKEQIVTEFGDKYLKIRRFKSKIKGAQEAHEAIRPTYMNKPTVGGTEAEKRLYQLIWKRTIASQMSDAQLERTTFKIKSPNFTETFVANGEVLKFDGFLKVYMESNDDENEETGKGLLPALKVKDILDYQEINAVERFTSHLPRYTEASLVKKMEELGIGRPSTYAPTISTVQNRGYVIKESREGKVRNFNLLTLQNEEIQDFLKKETYGSEKNKLFPTDIGMVVTDFLKKNFENIMDYNFTASVEKDFDEIADGKLVWNKMIDDFYKPFHDKVESTVQVAQRNDGERILGDDPKTGKTILVRIGRYGPMAQLGKKENGDEPKFAALLRGQHLETITLQEAIDLFKLPRTVGKYEDKVVVAAIGRFGPYIRHDSKFVSLKKDIDDPMTVDLERAIVLIEEKREADRKKHIKSFEEEPELKILNGRWGPYISFEKKNYKIPKTVEPTDLTLEDCKKIIAESPVKKTRGRTTRATKTSKTKTKRTTKAKPRTKKK